MHHNRIIHTTTTQTDWHRTLTSGDVVSFQFPLAEEDPDEKPKDRPCLVLARCGPPEAPRAVLAYGTSSKCKANAGLEIDVRRPADRVVAGLRKRTRFIGCRRVTAALDDPRFVIEPSIGSPVLGHLPGNPADRLQVVLSQLRDEDIEGDGSA